MKEVFLRRLYMVWLHFHDILEKPKLQQHMESNSCESLLTCSQTGESRKINHLKSLEIIPRTSSKQRNINSKKKKKKNLWHVSKRSESHLSETTLPVLNPRSYRQRHPSRLWQQEHGAPSPLWSFLHGGHKTPVFLILFTASCSWGEVLGECGQEMGISSAHAPAPPLCKKVSTLRSGRGWETESKADNLIFLPQEMNFICKSVQKCSNLRIISRTVEVVVKGNWGGGIPGFNEDTA